MGGEGQVHCASDPVCTAERIGRGRAYNTFLENALQCPSMLTWGFASLRQTTDFTVGYIADRSCREEQFDLTSMMPSPTQ
jgi:hypothetical protein